MKVFTLTLPLALTFTLLLFLGTSCAVHKQYQKSDDPRVQLLYIELNALYAEQISVQSAYAEYANYNKKNTSLEVISRYNERLSDISSNIMTTQAKIRALEKK